MASPATSKPATSDAPTLAGPAAPPTPPPALPPAGERGQVKNATYIQRRTRFGDPNPDKLSVADYRKMELDDNCRAGIKIRELAILGKPGDFHYKPRDPEDAVEVEQGKRMVRFLQHVWTHLDPDPTQVLLDVLSARRFGFAVLEMVWASQYGADGKPQLRRIPKGEFAGFVTVEKLKLLPHETLEKNGFLADEWGNLRAVAQTVAIAPDRDEDRSIVVRADPPERRLPIITFEGDDLNRLIIYRANPKHRGDYYGESDHKAAYNPWYSKNAAIAGRNMLLERLAGVVVGGYGNANEQAALEDALDNIGPGAVLTVPLASDVKILEGAREQVDAFHESIREDDLHILRAYLVPTETVGGSTDSSGSYARAATHFESFLVSLRKIAQEVEEVVEEQFVKRLIDVNFGPQETYPSFDFPEPASKDKESLARIYDTAVKTGYADPAIDAEWMRRELDMPEAPKDHVFAKPATPALGPGAPGADPFGPVVDPYGAARMEAAAPPAAEHVATLQQEADTYVLEAKSRLANALRALQRRVLAEPPQGAADAERVVVLPRDIQDELDMVASSILYRVVDDFNARMKRLAPHRATIRASKPRAFLRRLFAADPAPMDKALMSYTQWSRALNKTIAEEQANKLQSRLRRRILQGFTSGQNPDDVARGLADEFSSYTQAMLDTVTNTTVMDYYNSARNASFDAAGDFVQGVRIVSLLDRETTPFCRDINGRTIAKTDPDYDRVRRCPYWYGCRDTVVPILAGESVTFDTDWAEWLAEHEDVEGGGFLYGKS